MFYDSARPQWSTARYLAVLALIPLAINFSNVLLTLHGSSLAKPTPTYSKFSDRATEFHIHNLKPPQHTSTMTTLSISPSSTTNAAR